MRLGAWSITLLTVAAFGGGMAFIVPIVFTLALRLSEIAPGREYLLGASSAVGPIAGPLVGAASDRHRGGRGRRRPFVAAGVLLGLAAAPVLATSPVLGVLLAGAVTGDRALVFLLPAALGALLVSGVVLGVREPAVRGRGRPPTLTLGRLPRGYGFDPRRHPAFAWAWLGRFLVFFGIG